MGLLIIAFVVVLAVGEGRDLDVTALGGIEGTMFLAWLMALIGMAVLWKWEGAGGILTLSGMAAFYVLNFAASGRFPGGPVFPACFLPGVLALICWWRDRRLHNDEHSRAM
ncbi:hypothetical protein CA54_04200 [Symmachiella macrocystis]|uniref:DUF7670 domain-containing protein n=2 Tax=Symmachiella macrocystis TaxID=2527985 RepID=A0A5C6BIT3_9PLAN|nr:hypothetical protein CA54_04200 [Symmachiella macrocystis]